MKFTRASWESCERADLMLGYAAEIEVDIRILTGAKVECAKTVLHLMKSERSIKSLRVADQFAKGEASIDQLKIAANLAYSAANYPTGLSSFCATSPSSSAAASAAYNAAICNAFYNRGNYSDLIKESLKELSVIVRKAIPFEIIEKAQSKTN